jgi:glycosyltransferase involved in cell wall biosynthesis
MPTVSVIVPNYNHARFLPSRIESILRQTYQDFELILLDDCSSDDSRSILSRYADDPRVRIELNQVNSGSSFKQWNKGVSLARGKYVWIAESDDYADLRLLDRLLAFLDSDAAIAFAYCRSWRVTDHGRTDGFCDSYLHHLDPSLWRTDFRIEGKNLCRNYFLFTNPVQNASAVVFRREVYERIGGADETYRLCGDWKLWASAALTGDVAYTAEPLNYFRFHDSSVRTKSVCAALDVCERFRVVRWLSEIVAPEGNVLKELQRELAAAWVPVIMSTRVPLDVKRMILRDVRAIDPRSFRRATIPALRTIQSKLMKHWRAAAGLVPR